MERKIKFKAKRLDNSQWVEGDLIHSTNYTGIGYPSDEFPDVPIVHRVDPSTVCQYTGLKDCEGKEVWEHDITSDAGDEAEVIFYDGSFMLHDIKDRNHDEDIPLCRCGEKGMIINRVVGSKFDKEV